MNDQYSAAQELAGRRVLVTGAGGFIGRTLCELLLSDGAEVHGTQRQHACGAGVVPHALDLRDAQAWGQCFRDVSPEVVFHLASPIDLRRDPAVYDRLREGILDVTVAVARSCVEHDVRLVSVGTCESYGTQTAPFSEDLEPRPVSPYSSLKAEASSRVLAMTREEGLRATVARPFLTYGPGQSPERLIPSAVMAALSGVPFEMTDGRQTREFNFVGDVARGLCATASDLAIGRLVNIGGGPELPVAEVARKVFLMAGADVRLVKTGVHARRGGEVDRFYGDHRLARTLLGHTPRVSLEEGLQATIDAARAM